MCAHVCTVGAVCVDVDDAVFGHDAQQALEGEFDFFHIGVDVCVVHLDIVDDDDLGQVVEEFGAFVEEGGVVLIALEHAVVGVRKVAAAAEVAGDAADHEAGVQPVVLHEPSEHGGGGGFAVGAGDYKVLFAPEEELFHGLGQAHVAQVFLEHGFNLCIAAAHGVADDDEVCAGGDVVGLVALEDFDALAFQEGGHGRVDVGICAGNHKALASHGRGNGAHGCAADSEEVDVFHILQTLVRREEEIITYCAVWQAFFLTARACCVCGGACGGVGLSVWRWCIVLSGNAAARYGRWQVWARC